MRTILICLVYALALVGCGLGGETMSHRFTAPHVTADTDPGPGFSLRW